MSFLQSGDNFHLPTGQFLLMSNLKYDENQLVEKIKENDVDELCIVSLQLAVHGFGNREYGQVTINNVVKKVTDIFDENNVQYNNNSGMQLEADVMTPKRLVRVFRYQISEYLKLNPEIETFLFRKYATEGESWYIFPGSEYLVEELEHVDNLLQTYENMDDRLGTDFVKKIKNILVSRKVAFSE